jgi:molecular chaperone DnaK (HSP70)
MEDAEKAETLGQEESQEAVGIDLGTMNGRVAFYEKGRITLIGGDVGM